MKCDDARQCFPAFVGGPVALTDWALVEAHVRQCDECRTLLAQQKLSAVKLPRTQELVARLRASLEAPVRAAVPAVAGGIEVTRGGVTRVVDQLASDVARGIEAAWGGARRVPDLLARVHGLALLPFQWAGRAGRFPTPARLLPARPAVPDVRALPPLYSNIDSLHCPFVCCCVRMYRRALTI